jgi:hypothetical protein
MAIRAMRVLADRPLHGADDGPCGRLALAEFALDAARLRVTGAPLPPFVGHTASELLAFAARLIADERRDPGDPAAFAEAFHTTMGDLAACLSFGEEVVSEEFYAQRRLEALERRLDGPPLHPMLRGPVADLQETLRAMLHRLETGLYPLADFHHAFEEVAGRIDRLLVWEATLTEGAANA